jgi:signal transduction histidine kinase
VIEATTFAAQALFLCVAIYMAVAVSRSPRRSNYFALAFFALLAIVIGFTWSQPLLQGLPSQLSSVVTATLVLLIPYVLLRLAKEFSGVNPAIQRLSEAGLIGAIALAIYPGSENQFALLYLLAYFLSVAAYASRQFARAANTSNGISRMRFRALAYASILLGVGLFSVIITTFVGGLISDAVMVLRQFLLMASALLYFAGFSPPVMLRRAWQEPELRRFLNETRSIPQEPDTDRVITELERISAETVGAPYAAIGLFNEKTGMIDFRDNSLHPGETIGGRSFAENRAILSLDTISDDPESRDLYEYGGAYAVIAAPINTDDATIGVLALYSPNAPIFAEDDLSLLTLLADQIGILLENRSYIAAQAELHAREASTKMKDEFLSLAAHDLKTPLTTILASAQILERRISRSNPDAPELRSIVRLNREAERLRKLVEGLLDASRIEQGRLVTMRETTDVSSLIEGVIDRLVDDGAHRIITDIQPGLLADCDAIRIEQVVENLIENARKYSPPDSSIDVDLHARHNMIEFCVRDQGIGIDAEDQARVFDRYFRTETAEYRTVQGIGLGLYICKAIVEQHDGTISVESTPGLGSTFRFEIPQHSDAATSAATSMDQPVPLASNA